MAILEQLSQWWKDHGTKIIGTTITLLGTALAMGLIPAKYQTWAAWALTALGGGAVGRGFSNSAAAKSPPSA